ncbi:MAG: FAD-dependent monooxygenase [Burkholderiales bacterium]
MAQHSDIVIRGDGIVGCALALALANLRLRVGLQGPAASATAPAAPASSEHSDIRAYALNAASRQLLESLRCWPAAEFVTPVREMQVCGDHGGQLTFSASHLPANANGTPPALNWIVQAHALQTRLQEAVHFQPLIAPLQADDAGSQASASLLVAAEGQASASRAEWGVPWQAQPYAQRAIATRVRCALPHGQVARQWFGGGDVLAFLPLGNAQTGADGNLVAVVWSVSTERASTLLAADDAAFCQALAAFSQHALGGLTLAAERGSWPLQLARAGRCVGQHGTQSWALVGDAAHTVHPLAGLGLNLGLADAASLAQVLGAREYWRGVGDMKLLRRYERARALDWLGVAGATDGLQHLFAQTGEVWKTLRNWGLSGVDRSGPVKHWLVRQATGLTS